MILIECPSCEAPVLTSLPIPDAVRCDDCAVVWDIKDPDTQGAEHPAVLAA